VCGSADGLLREGAIKVRRADTGRDDRRLPAYDWLPSLYGKSNLSNLLPAFYTIDIAYYNRGNRLIMAIMRLASVIDDVMG
jgi:hypothetical protein